MSKKDKDKGFQLQELIKGNNFGFFICLCAVIFQALHTQYNLKRLSSLTDVFGTDLSEYHAMGLASIISMAILYFTLRKRIKYAIGWAVFEAYMNLCYYAIYISSTPENDNYLYWIAIPSSFALPAILGMFSHELLYDADGNLSYEDSKALKILMTSEIDQLTKKITEISVMNEVEKDNLKQDVFDIKMSLDKIIKDEFILENIDTGSIAKVIVKK